MPPAIEKIKKHNRTSISEEFNLKNKVFRNPIYFLAFGFGSGLMTFAPGTWGTLAAIPLFYMLSFLSTPFYIFFSIIAFLLGIAICDKVSKDLNKHDYAGIVWDEIVGYFITMIGVPVQGMYIILGFLLFRIFDILKPPPIRYIDTHLHGGFGIMFDDLLAAIPACLILHSVKWLLT